MGDEPTRYRFGPLERRGVVAGWRGGQLGLIAAALVASVLVIRALPSVAGAACAVVLVGAAVAAATWPIAGRSAEEWAPDALRHATSTIGRSTKRRRGPFSTLSVLPVDVGGANTHAAVVRDAATRRFTCVLPASATGFVLLGEDEKEARVAAWSGLLAALARQGSAVHRLQWVARSLPDDGTEARRYLADAAVLAPGHAARRSYRTLLEHEQPAAHVHEVFLSVTIDSTRSARAVRGAGGGDVGACAVLLREAASMRRLLSDAGIDAGAVLGPAGFDTAVRRAFEASPGPPGAGRTGVWPWPMAAEPSWSCLRVDGTWHATYWVAEWPRRDVGPDFLGPLLVSDVRRTMSLVMEPMSALEAARHVEQARTADIADAELRRRGGFLSTARRTREEEVLVHRERELAEGHAHYRFAGYVTVSAADPEALDVACGRTEQAAGRAGLELRRCYGDQDRAFACTLPLGRGLP